MNHIIYILAHKNFQQLKRLTSKLVSDFDILVHIDKKTNLSEKEKSLIETFDSRVFFTEKRINIQLAQMSMVKVIELLLHQTTKLEIKLNKNYSYCLLLSGQDYPLISSNDLKIKLDQFFPKPIINMVSILDAKWMNSVISRHRFISLHNYIYKVFGRNFISYRFLMPIIYILEIIYSYIFRSPLIKINELKLDVYAGSAWWILSKKDLDMVFSKFNSEYRLREIYNHILTPEEHFFQTMLNFCGLINQKNKNNYNINGPTFACFTHPSKGLSQGGHPFILELEDFAIINFQEYLFARKFDILIDEKILDKIDSLHN